MNKIRIASIALISALAYPGAMMAAGDEPNALPNGGFEQGFEHWSKMNHSVLETDAHGGINAARLTANETEIVRLETSVQNPPKAGTLGIWHKVPSGAKANSPLTVIMIPLATSGAEVPQGRRFFIVKPSRDNDWHQFFTEFKLPPNTARLVLRFSINDTEVPHQNRGVTAYVVDDITLTPSANP
ncbi:MAG: hypothetical protein ACFUZC_11185 [Chthoniobacteraceae bacterium]